MNRKAGYAVPESLASNAKGHIIIHSSEFKAKAATVGEKKRHKLVEMHVLPNIASAYGFADSSAAGGAWMGHSAHTRYSRPTSCSPTPCPGCKVILGQAALRQPKFEGPVSDYWTCTVLIAAPLETRLCLICGYR